MKSVRIKKQDFFIILISISCILLQYQAVVMSYGLIVLLIVCLFESKKIICLDKSFFIMVSVIAVGQIICCLLFKYYLQSFFGSIINLYIIVFVCSSAMLVQDKERMYKCLLFVAVVCTVAILVQFFIINILRHNVSAIMIIPQNEEQTANWVQNYYRPSGFFSEAQTHCSFMIPIVLATLNKKEYKWAIFLSMGIVLTGSSLGIGLLAIIWLFMLFFSSMQTNNKIAIAVTIIIALICFLTLEPFEFAREKILTVFTDFSLYTSAKMTNSFSYSNYLRLIKGWVTYGEMPLLEKIFGVGIANFVTFLSKSTVSFSWHSIWTSDATMAAYFTSASGVFVECGLVGAVAYYLFLSEKIRKGNSLGKMIIIALLIQSFMAQAFFNSIFIFYFLVYYAMSDSNCRLIKLRIGA